REGAVISNPAALGLRVVAGNGHAEQHRDAGDAIFEARAARIAMVVCDSAVTADRAVEDQCRAVVRNATAVPQTVPVVRQIPFDRASSHRQHARAVGDAASRGADVAVDLCVGNGRSPLAEDAAPARVKGLVAYDGTPSERELSFPVDDAGTAMAAVD